MSVGQCKRFLFTHFDFFSFYESGACVYPYIGAGGGRSMKGGRGEVSDGEEGMRRGNEGSIVKASI